MNAKQERDATIVTLKMLKERAENGIFTKTNLQTALDIMLMLAYKAYESDIQQEESDRVHDEIMNEMTWEDFQD